MDFGNRSNILNCALQLFAAKGYDAVGIQRIVDAAQITKPTLYHYFGSKQGLLAALLGEHFDLLNQAIEQAAVYEGDLPVTLNKITSAYFQFACQHPVFYRMQLAMWFAPADSEPFKIISSLKDRQQELVKAVFLLASDHHAGMKERHRIYAATYVGMIHTYISLWLNGYIQLGEIVANKAVHQFLHGIFP